MNLKPKNSPLACLSLTSIMIVKIEWDLQQIKNKHTHKTEEEEEKKIEVKVFKLFLCNLHL